MPSNVLDEARDLVLKRLADLDDERKRLERALAELGRSGAAGSGAAAWTGCAGWERWLELTGISRRRHRASGTLPNTGEEIGRTLL